MYEYISSHTASRFSQFVIAIDANCGRHTSKNSCSLINVGSCFLTMIVPNFFRKNPIQSKHNEDSPAFLLSPSFPYDSALPEAVNPANQGNIRPNTFENSIGDFTSTSYRPVRSFSFERFSKAFITTISGMPSISSMKLITTSLRGSNAFDT